jgi:hypothetical protein
VLNVGDHPFIVRPSWIDFYRAEIVLAQKFVSGVQAGLMFEKAPLSDEVYQRVIDALFVSQRTPPKAKKFLGTLLGRWP